MARKAFRDCPDCNEEVHVRKRTCECGHYFPTKDEQKKLAPKKPRGRPPKDPQKQKEREHHAFGDIERWYESYGAAVAKAHEERQFRKFNGTKKKWSRVSDAQSKKIHDKLLESAKEAVE